MFTHIGTLKKKELCRGGFEFPCWISRYSTASLHSLTLAPPLRSGNAGLFTLLAHGSWVWWWEGPSGETVWKHVHISTGSNSTGSLSLSLSPKETFFSAQATVPRKKRGPPSRLFFSLGRPWKERESQNKDNRHNHQEKLSTWRRNSLATRIPLPGKSWDTVSWQCTCLTLLFTTRPTNLLLTTLNPNCDSFESCQSYRAHKWSPFVVGVSDTHLKKFLRSSLVS